MRSKLITFSKEVKANKRSKSNIRRLSVSRSKEFDSTMPIFGIVNDTNGNPIEGANVEITGLVEGDMNNNVTHEVINGVSTTNSTGQFFLSLKYHSVNNTDFYKGRRGAVKLSINYKGSSMNSRIPTSHGHDLKKILDAISLGRVAATLKLLSLTPNSMQRIKIAAKAIDNPIVFNAGSVAQSRKWGIGKNIETVELFHSASNQSLAMSPTTFPLPATIMSHYPTPSEYCSYADNECAIRMSIAFQKAGADISGSNSFRPTHKHSGDAYVHQPSAAALADWLHTAIKYPKKYDKGAGQEYQQSDFIDKEGIIYFVHPGERGGTGPGHFDVISGGKIGSGFYANQKIWFWEHDGTKYI